jgi:citrate lyase gamma subunit
MNDTHRQDPRPADGMPNTVSHDLRALRDVTARDLPQLSQTVSEIRSRLAAPTWRERLMSSSRPITSRPWLASGLVAAAIVIAMLVIPISYLRTTGHQVSLRVSGSADATQLHAIASELKSQLHAEGVRVRLEEQNGAPTATFEAMVPIGNRVDAAAVANAFATGLTERGLKSSAETTPVRERVSGSVYAYAKDLVIQVSTDGKSSAQIEAEIRQRLADAGIRDAQVSVTDEGANARKVTLNVKRTSDDHSPAPSDISLQLTKNGQPLGVNGPSVRIERMRSPAGESLHLVVSNAGKSTTFDVPNADKMSDAQLQSTIESKLREAGLDLQVTVTNGNVEVKTKS